MAFCGAKGQSSRGIRDKTWARLEAWHVFGTAACGAGRGVFQLNGEAGRSELQSAGNPGLGCPVLLYVAYHSIYCLYIKLHS